ncbi:MAG: glutamine amidotransferase [Pseudomonadota bacterium]
MSKAAIAVRHIHFEDLGTFADVLADSDFAIRYHDVGSDDLSEIDPLGPDLLVVLGGPVGVYETELYPFLAEEQRILKARLAANRPTLGICLGAQQIAAALGAMVAPMGVKEIGFGPLTLTDAGRSSPLRRLEGAHVLHWHGDAFAIPENAAHLAATPVCAAQAFAIGRNILGLQFHAEIEGAGIERWLVGHAGELSSAGIDPRTLRDDAARVDPGLRQAAGAMMREWLAALGE